MANPTRSAIETSNEKSDLQPTDGHSPGHQTINLKDQFTEKTGDKSHPQNESAMNQMANSDRIFRHKTPQRRIITGAALGKKGQRDRE